MRGPGHGRAVVEYRGRVRVGTEGVPPPRLLLRPMVNKGSGWITCWWSARAGVGWNGKNVPNCQRPQLAWGWDQAVECGWGARLPDWHVLRYTRFLNVCSGEVGGGGAWQIEQPERRKFYAAHISLGDVFEGRGTESKKKSDQRQVSKRQRSTGAGDTRAVYVRQLDTGWGKYKLGGSGITRHQDQYRCRKAKGAGTWYTSFPMENTSEGLVIYNWLYECKRCRLRPRWSRSLDLLYRLWEENVRAGWERVEWLQGGLLSPAVVKRLGRVVRTAGRGRWCGRHSGCTQWCWAMVQR